MPRPAPSLRVLALLAAATFSGVSATVYAQAPATEASKPPTHAEQLGKPDIVAKDASRDLKQSHVTAYLTREHTPATNLLWCASFQIAWDQLASVFESPVTLSGHPTMAVELNKFPWEKSGLDEDSYVAVAGIGPSTIDRIHKALNDKFKGAASPSVIPATTDIGPRNTVAYAYLFKNLQFETALTARENGMDFIDAAGHTTRVKSFGIFHDTQQRRLVAAQVTVHSYTSPNDFVIEIATKHKGDRLIIARRAPGKTLKETVDATMSAAGALAEVAGLEHDERLEIPVMNFDVTRSYAEVAPATITSKLPARLAGPEPYIITSALQNIRFRLDEKGAILKSDAGITGAPGAVAPPKQREPRRFVCDRSFLVLMARDGAKTPYFAAWIENPELLTPVKK